MIVKGDNRRFEVSREPIDTSDPTDAWVTCIPGPRRYRIDGQDVSREVFEAEMKKAGLS